MKTGSPPVVISRLGTATFGLITSDHRYQVWHTNSLSRPMVDASVPGEVSEWTIIPLSETFVAFEDQTTGSEALRVMDVTSGHTKYSYNLTRDVRVEAMAASSVKGLLAWVEQEQLNPHEFRVRVVDWRSGDLIMDSKMPLITPGVQRIGSLAIAPDGQSIAFGSWQGEGAVGAVDLRTKVLIWHQKTQPRGGTWRIACYPDSKSFFATDDCGQLTRYETHSGKVLSQTRLDLPSQTIWGDQAAERLLAVDVSPDGKYVAAGTDYGKKVVVWLVASGAKHNEFSMSKWPAETVLIFDSDSKGIWVAGSQDRQVTYLPLE